MLLARAQNICKKIISMRRLLGFGDLAFEHLEKTHKALKINLFGKWEIQIKRPKQFQALQTTSAYS